MAYTMLSFSNNQIASSFLTNDEVKSVCPAAYKEKATNPNVSERYVFIPTSRVIDDLAELGWYPVEAKQCRQLSEGSVRSFHMVAFQNPNVYISKLDGNGGEMVDCFPRIILTNSHDGFSSFRFMIGLFRCVCSNGLIIATDQLVDIYVRHVNYDFEELRKVVMTATAGAAEQANVMNDMASIMLTEKQKEELAIEALRIRKGKKEGKKFHIDMEAVAAILTPKRTEDEGNSLWNVFNVLQENMMRGGYKAASKAGAKPRRARALTSVAKSVDFNKKFFRSAHRYVDAVALA